ncbi:MAG: hypothetical protein K9M44_03900 [Candidatus Pacebacteria bacterium]|nr:hypothetical protein [Candidatus Paceibacterota bacterium]
MKKSKILTFLTWSVFGVLIAVSILVVTDKSLATEVSNSCDASSCRVSPGNSIVVDMHGTAKLIENNTSKEIFIPVSTATEWAQFRTYYPVNITMLDPTCDLPWGGTINHGESVTAYSEPNNYGCIKEPITRICEAGVLSGDSNYDSATEYVGDTITYNYNGSVLSAKCVEKNGLSWLDRNLGASRVATSYDDDQAYGGYFQWGRDDDGHQVSTSGTTSTVSSSDDPGHDDFIKGYSPNIYDWRDPQNDNLWQGENGINNPCPAGWRLPVSSELDTERLTWNTNNRAGAYDSILKWTTPGLRMFPFGDVNFIGSTGYIWSSSIDNLNVLTLITSSSNVQMLSRYRAYGASVRCVRDDSHVVLNYSATTGGSISGDSEQIITSGGNGTTVEAIADSGYTFIQWSDGSTDNPRTDMNVLEDIDLIAEFVACGDSVTFIYNGSPVVYGTVFKNGKCWLDRNLGASQVCVSKSDSSCYGDLFQWGRDDDGHQLRTSNTTSNLSSSDNPGHDDFIVSGSYPYDWRNPKNDNLWQGVIGTNNPCPSEWRLPTTNELNTERLSWATNDATGAYSSSLKWPSSGLRHSETGSFYYNGSWGHALSSSVYLDEIYFLVFYSDYGGGASVSNTSRAGGYSVRCIQDL